MNKWYNLIDKQQTWRNNKQIYGFKKTVSLKKYQANFGKNQTDLSNKDTIYDKNIINDKNVKI